LAANEVCWFLIATNVTELTTHAADLVPCFVAFETTLEGMPFLVKVMSKGAQVNDFAKECRWVTFLP